MECGLERGKCDVDDGAVDERQAAAEDGGGQNPGTGLRGTRRVGGSGLDDGFVAGEAHSGYGCREAAEGSVEPKHKSDGREAPLGSTRAGRGLRFILVTYPPLAWWVCFCRRFAAGAGHRNV